MISRLSDRAIGTVMPIDPAPLIGDWINYDRDSGNIVRLMLAPGDSGLVLRVFGAPEIDWGETLAHPFSLTVAGGAAVAFQAAYDFDFLRTAILGYLNKRLLVVDAYSTFHDGSGRANYFVRAHFYIP